MSKLGPIVAILFFAVACSDDRDDDDDGHPDFGPRDAMDAAPDAKPDAEEDASADGGELDADPADADPLDGDPLDGEPVDGDPIDAEPIDAEPLDGDVPDADPMDAIPDGGVLDTGTSTTIADLNDEFDDATTISDWTFRNDAEGTPAQHNTIDINTTTADHLVIIPSTSVAWVNGIRSIFLYKTVTGDFVMQTHVRAVQASNPALPVLQQFNSAGLMARDPQSPNIGESWTFLDIGYQISAFGTRAANTAGSSTSNFYRSTVETEGDIVLCRIGSDFHLYYTTASKGGLWTLASTFSRPDLPATLQVGVGTDSQGAQPYLRAEFDYVRFAVPTAQSDCTANIPRN